MGAEEAGRFRELVALACEGWRLPDDDRSELIRAHLNGALVVPTMLWLHETGRLVGDGPAFGDDVAGEAMGRLLSALGWIDSATAAWTEHGRQARTFALNFGGVATYLPMLARLPELYRGELTVGADHGSKQGEWHVHRELNLTISAAAHKRYFRDSDPIFLELFSREPVSAQPRFIAEMGCGAGSWLIHLHGLVSERTLRGKHLDSDPLPLIGIDIDAEALEQARRNLKEAGVPALLLHGDVTDPDDLRATLAEHGLAIEDGLHIRAFIDHERTYLGTAAPVDVPGWSSGAYLDAQGHPLTGEAVEKDLIAHLRRWAPHVHKHGMVVLEAHCIAPAVAARHLGSLHSVALDAHQAYSKQYPVDHAAFLRCCHEAGLQTPGHSERRYPMRKPFVAVSLNRLLGASEPLLPAMDETSHREGTWRPGADADLSDGIALHEILFERGDIRYPAGWCSGATGFVVAGALEVIEMRLACAKQGETIRILDYGAGTGTATIELLKACRERGLEARLAERRVSIEVHLVDLPSSWFAQAFALLKQCAWTRFHSLRAPDGGFRALRELTGAESVDAVMANMVFHLIPPGALGRATDQLASVLAPHGRLLWSSPDLGPPGPGSVLLHDPNRALRRRLLEREGFDGGAADDAQERANRRILPRPLTSDVTAALATRLAGEITHRTYEMLSENIVRGLLVPSNQAEYLPEIADRERRERVIRELMEHEVLPAMQGSEAGTALGLNLHWTLGTYRLATARDLKISVIRARGLRRLLAPGRTEITRPARTRRECTRRTRNVQSRARSRSSARPSFRPRRAGTTHASGR